MGKMDVFKAWITGEDRNEKAWRRIVPSGEKFGTPPPEGVDPKTLADVPSGFVDEPDVYDEVHLGETRGSRQVEEFTVLVDPKKAEVVATVDLPFGEKDERRRGK